ncbi:MAG TPA: DsbA family protein [Longimicrobium sp.]|nr:DsbA family protein [Longimicrobium sp.]
MPRPPAKPRRNPLLPFYVLLGVVFLAGAFMLFRQSTGGGAAANTLEQVVMTPEQLQRVPGISQGAANAPLVLMEFADFQCPGCGQFARFSKPLMKDYVDNGTVRFVWYDFPLTQIHKNAVLASRAGRCANDQNQFWAYHDAVFTNQTQWSESEKAADRFVEYAERVGLDRGAFGECLRSEKYQKEVSESFQLGTTLGVNSTPTLFLNGKRVQETPQTRADWDALIRAELGSAAPAAAPVTGAATAPAAGAAPATSSAP